MKRNALFVLFTILFLALMLLPGCGYNTMVTMNEKVDASWADVENQYQRRLDLIPNLVSTVKGYAEFEQETLTAVTEARAQAGGVMQMSDELMQDPEAFERFQQAQNELSSALQRLLVVTENYPNLRANENFLALQDQLEGTENRIAVARMNFNEAVQKYNSHIKKFPTFIVANWAGFESRAYFEATAGAEVAPVVEF